MIYFFVLFPQQIIHHPDYSLMNKQNDIALIRLTRPLHFTEYVRPACLETNTNDVDATIKLIQIGKSITTSAFHTVFLPQSRSSVLLVHSFPMHFMNFLARRSPSQDLIEIENLQTMPLSQCNDTYLDYNKNRNLSVFRNGLSQGQYCVHDPTKDSCGVFSGSPLLIPPSNSSLPNIIGLTSMGVGETCSSAHPEILTRVAHYVPWIESHVWPNEGTATHS